MTRLEAIRSIRRGQKLIKMFYPEWDGVERELEVRISHRPWCDYPRREQWKHEAHGPVHVRLWGAGPPIWIHISAKQLLGFIKRNYPR